MLELSFWSMWIYGFGCYHFRFARVHVIQAPVAQGLRPAKKTAWCSRGVKGHLRSCTLQYPARGCWHTSCVQQCSLEQYQKSKDTPQKDPRRTLGVSLNCSASGLNLKLLGSRGGVVYPHYILPGSACYSSCKALDFE